MYKSWMFKQKSWGLQNADNGEGNQNSGGGSGDSGEAAAQAAAAAAAKQAEDAKNNANLTDDQKKALQTLADEKADLLREVMDKKARLKDTSEKLTEAQKKLKDFEGLDANEIRELLKERQERERKTLEDKGQWEALKAQIIAEHQREKAELEGKLTSSVDEKSNLSRQIAELTVGSAFNSSGYIKEDLILTPSKARALFGMHFEYVEGKVVGFDKPAGSASRTQLVDGKGEPLAFEAALKKLIDADPEKDSLLRSKSKPGAGSITQTSGKQGTPVTTGVRTGAEKIAAGLAKMNKQ